MKRIMMVIVTILLAAVVVVVSMLGANPRTVHMAALTAIEQGNYEMAVSHLKREIIYGTLVRIAIVPALGLGLAYLFFRDSFTGAHFASLVALFATPVAVSSVPMAQEMKSDAVLAGQLVVFTTVFSAFSVAIVSFLLKWAGIFG